MRYVCSEINKSDIIFSFEQDGNYYNKTFLDGSECEYYSSDENEVEKIRKEMIEQAKKRQEIMKPNYYQSKALLFLSTALLSFTLMNKITDPALSGYALLLLMGGVASFMEFIRNIRIKKELKKYNKFLDMCDDLKTIQCLDHDFDLPILNIETLDKFDNTKINIMYDEYKKIKKKENL